MSQTEQADRPGLAALLDRIERAMRSDSAGCLSPQLPENAQKRTRTGPGNDYTSRESADGRRAKRRADDLQLLIDAWPDLLGGRLTFDEAIDTGKVTPSGDTDRIRRILACFDVPGLLG